MFIQFVFSLGNCFPHVKWAKLIYLAVSAVVMHWVEKGSVLYAKIPVSLADFDIGVGVHAPLVGSVVLVAKFKGSHILQI